MIKLKKSTNDCHLCGDELDSNGNYPRYLPRTSEDYEIVKGQLTLKDDKQQGCCNSINGLESLKDTSRDVSKDTKKCRHTTQASNQMKKSLLVCNYDQSAGSQQNQLANTKQQITITIDSNSITDNSSRVHESTSSKVCKRLQNKLRILRKLLPTTRKTASTCTDDIEECESAVDRSIGLKTNGHQLEHHHHHHQLDNNHNIEEIEELKELMESDHRNDLDYEIEQIDKLKQNFKMRECEKNINALQDTRERQTCRLHHQRHQSREEEQISRLIVKRALSKQSISVCLRCSTSDCECKSHTAKQLIKSTRSTPITGSNRLLDTTMSRARKQATTTNKRKSRPLKLTSHIDTSTQLNNRIEVLIKNSRYKVAKMMIVIILVFFVCWLPLYIIFTKLKLGLQFTSYTQLEEKITFLLTPIAQWICYINSCINPILYAFLNKKYRAEFKKLFSNVRCFHFFRPNRKKNNLKHTSTVLKASVKSYPPVTVHCERNLDKYKGNITVKRNEDKSDRGNSKKIITTTSPKSLNDYFRRQELAMKEEQQRASNAKPKLNRSLSDINLKKKIIFKRASFSGPLS